MRCNPDLRKSSTRASEAERAQRLEFFRRGRDLELMKSDTGHTHIRGSETEFGLHSRSESLGSWSCSSSLCSCACLRNHF